MIQTANLGLRFLLEILALVAMAAWGFQAHETVGIKILLGLGVPLAAALVWGIFRVPNDPGRATVPIPGPLRLLLELVFFAGAVTALLDAGQPALAWIFGAAVVINNAIMFRRVRRLLLGRSGN